MALAGDALLSSSNRLTGLPHGSRLEGVDMKHWRIVHKSLTSLTLAHGPVYWIMGRAFSSAAGLVWTGSHDGSWAFTFGSWGISRLPMLAIY